MIIGISINEAIDWTQDCLRTTRPFAERTLFSLLSDRSVEETEDGFVLHEAEEEVERRHNNVKTQSLKKYSRYKFHSKRKNAKQRHQSKMKHLDNSTAAEKMLQADGSDGYDGEEDN